MLLDKVHRLRQLPSWVILLLLAGAGSVPYLNSLYGKITYDDKVSAPHAVGYEGSRDDRISSTRAGSGGR